MTSTYTEGWLVDEEQVSMGVGQARWIKPAGDAEQEEVAESGVTWALVRHVTKPGNTKN